jgi:hypothetical protein
MNPTQGNNNNGRDNTSLRVLGGELDDLWYMNIVM